MKLLFTFLLTLIAYSHFYGQAIVSDPTAHSIKIKMAKEQAISNRKKLAKAAAILKQSEGSLKRLSEIKSHYDKIEENITIVNDYLLTGREVYDIIQTFTEAERVYNEAERTFTNDDAVAYSERLAMIKMFTLIFLDITSYMEDSKELTKSGAYKMNDNDRLLGVVRAKNKIKKKLNLMRYAMRRYAYAKRLAASEQGSLEILNRSMEVMNQSNKIR